MNVLNFARGLQFDGAVTYVSYAYSARAVPFIRVKGKWVQAHEGDTGWDRDRVKRVLSNGKWVPVKLSIHIMKNTFA